jgi:hypothetical protein
MKFLVFTFQFLILSLAQAATVRAYVQPDKARPNQTINYVISVQDGQVQSLPGLRFPLQIAQTSGVSTSQQISIVNGRQSVSLQLSWGIAASEPGAFVIPPQTIVVDGQSMTTNEVKLTVEQGGAAFPNASNGQTAEDKNAPILQIELGKKEIYQGEVVPVNCSLYVPRQTQLRRLGLIEIAKSDFAIARFPQTNEQTSTVIDGIGYYVLTFRSTLSSLRTGDLKVGPATLELLVEVPMEGQPRQILPPGFPQGFFGGVSEPRKMVVKSQQVTLKVLPLPTEGKPANFSGAVGDFQMTATATPTDLTVGDPVSVELAVTGAGNFDALTTPALISNGGWKLYPAKRYNIEGQLDQNQTPTLERKVGYSQVLVPEAVHPAVPPFELNFFSAAERKYVTLRTQPIPLAMKPAPANAATESAPVGTTVVADLPPPVVDPQADITDILINPAASSRWIAPTGMLLLKSRAFWTAQAVPVGLFALASVLALARRRREERNAGRAGELREAWSSFEKAGADDHDFLHRAAQLIQTASGASPTVDPAVKAILDRYANTNFSAAPAAPLSSSERRSMQQTLSELMRKSLAKLSVLALALLCLGTAQAADSKPGTTPDEIYREAVTELKNANYTKAQYLAESLTKKNPPLLSAEVFELIGHARYRQKDLGRAALWYQRAQLLNGRTPELRQNLRHLFERSRYLTFGSASPLTAASTWLTLNEWLILAAVGLWMVFLSLSWRVFTGLHSAIWPVIVSVTGLLILVPASALAALRPESAERVEGISIVTQPDVNSYTSATVTSGTVIPLPPGSQVRTLEKRGTWLYVEIPSQPENLRGWVESGAVTPLWIWDTNLVP